MAGSLWVPVRRFDPNDPEMIDRPDADPVLLRDELKNLRIINRRFGGRAALRSGLLDLVKRSAPGRTLTLLDLGTGSGDQAVEAVLLFRSLNIDCAITAVDINPVVLAEAREYTAGIPEISVECADLRSLPYQDGQFDIVLCSLTAHHCSDSEVTALLREMSRLSKAGFILVDLERSYLALAAAWVYTRMVTTNIMTRTDAIVSILAAFTRGEIEAVALQAGASGARVLRKPFFLLSMVYVKGSDWVP